MNGRALAAFCQGQPSLRLFPVLVSSPPCQLFHHSIGGKHESIQVQVLCRTAPLHQFERLLDRPVAKAVVRVLRVAENSELRIDSKQLIECQPISNVIKRPAWQRHQIAVAYARYQEMLNSKVDEQIQWVVTKLATWPFHSDMVTGLQPRMSSITQTMSRSR